VTAFLDTGYFIAVQVEADQWHGVAVLALHVGLRLVTSSLVINETIALLQSRRQFSTALDFLRRIRAEPTIEIVYVDPVLQSEAWDLFHRWGGSGANPIDCASFAIMRRLNIKKAFTFDRHFRTAGFEILG
jgi:predicted nucleic acid-binding protein